MPAVAQTKGMVIRNPAANLDNSTAPQNELAYFRIPFFQALRSVDDVG